MEFKRRNFLVSAIAMATAGAVDLDQLLWIPGKRMISIPKSFGSSLKYFNVPFLIKDAYREVQISPWNKEFICNLSSQLLESSYIAPSTQILADAVQKTARHSIRAGITPRFEAAGMLEPPTVAPIECEDGNLHRGWSSRQYRAVQVSAISFEHPILKQYAIQRARVGTDMYGQIICAVRV